LITKSTAAGNEYVGPVPTNPALEPIARGALARLDAVDVADVADRGEEGEVASPPSPPSFDEVYAEHFDFVFRTLRRLGTPQGLVDDAVQEVFLVVHRRLGEFQGGAALTTWLYRIVVNVAQHARRSARRKGIVDPEDPDTLPIDDADGPHERAKRAEGVRLLQRVLGELDDDQRVVFVLAEYEDLGLREIAAALGENVNTVSSRLRAARQAFDQAVRRHRALDQWRMR
jgi:RNA polymerase sigma-70 factor, ECF subfamily